VKVVKVGLLVVLLLLEGLILTFSASARVYNFDKVGPFKISLSLHQDLTMGEIDKDIYAGATPEGGGSFAYLEKRENTISVSSKAPAWYRGGILDWSLRIEVVGVNPSDLNIKDLKIKRSSQANYESLPILRRGSGNESFGVDYRYDVDIDDIPGIYMITIRYTVTALRGRLRVSKNVNLTWQANAWAILAVHKEVNLGIISESTYIGATPQGGGSFRPLEASANNIFVITNDPGGWKLEVEPIDWITPSNYQSSEKGLRDLYWRGDKQTSYKTVASLNKRSTVDDSHNTQGNCVYRIGYKYYVGVDDIEGNYAVTLRYILSTTNARRHVTKITGLIWQAESWIVLAVHNSVNLGAIDQSLVEVDARGNISFKSLKKTDNYLFVISNACRGWSLNVKATDITVPSGFSGNLLEDFNGYWREKGKEEKSRPGKKFGAVPINIDKTLGPGSHIYTIDYEYNVDADDIEGNYSIALVYSVSLN